MALTRKPGAAVRKWDGGPFRVLSFDPGMTTGWASATCLQASDEIVFESGQLGPHEHHAELWAALGVVYRVYPNLEVVCESFEFRQHINQGQAKTKVELISKEYIGVIKLFCAMYDIKLTFYTASAAKQLVPDKGPQANEKLKQLGIYRPVTHWPHAMDGYRHLLRYLVVGKGIREPITDKWLGN